MEWKFGTTRDLTKPGYHIAFGIPEIGNSAVYEYYSMNGDPGDVTDSEYYTYVYSGSQFNPISHIGGTTPTNLTKAWNRITWNIFPVNGVPQYTLVNSPICNLNRYLV